MGKTENNSTIDFTDPSFKKIDIISAISIGSIITILSIKLIELMIVGYFHITSIWKFAQVVIGMFALFLLLTLIHEACHWITAKILGVQSKIGFRISFSTPAYVVFKKGQEFTKRPFIVIALAPFIVSSLLILCTTIVTFYFHDELHLNLLVLLTQLINLAYCIGDLSFVVQAKNKVKDMKQRIVYVGTKDEHKYRIC